MNTAVENRPFVITGVSGVGGLLLLFLLLFLLSFVQREEIPEREIQPLDVRSVAIPHAEEDSHEMANTPISQTAPVAKLPAQPKRLPSRTVEPMPLSLQVDVSQVLEERNTLDYIMSQRNLFGAFGFVRMEGVDSVPKTLYLPPNLFPNVLKEQGIYSGKVLLLIEISEQGIGRVRRVIEADYPELVDPVVDSVHGAIYSRPKRHGKPTRTIIKSLIYFRSGPEGDNLKIESQETQP